MRLLLSCELRAAALCACALAFACSSSKPTAVQSGRDAGATTGGTSAAGSGGTTAAGSAGKSSNAGASGARAGSSGTGGSKPAKPPANDAGNAGMQGAAGASEDDAGVAPAPGDATRPGWKLTMSDEFDGAKGSAVDASKWNLVNKGDGFGNNELEFYTNRTDNAALDGNGFLVITAKKETYMGRMYTSARLESAGKIEQAYGRFEARIKIPRGQGIWPAFWILGNNISSVNWPQCGEIDIMENVGKEPSIVHGSMHGPGYSGGNPLTASYTLPNNAKFADDFHVFAIEWEMNVVRFYVDDMLYETRTPKDLPANTTWVYDHPFYVILNVAVGGTWPGSPDMTTMFPQTMQVDYVRVYSR